MGELSFPKFRILQVYRKHLLIYLALASNSDDISSMCNLFCLTAEGWPDDDANCRSWNYSCRSYLGHFPSFSGMTNLYHLPDMFQNWTVVFFLWPLSALLYVFVSFTLSLQNPSKMKKAQAEIDEVSGKGKITFDSVKKLEYVLLFKSHFYMAVHKCNR